MLVVITSCSKPKNDSPIVGSWKLDSIRVHVNFGNIWEPASNFGPSALNFYEDGSFSQSNTILNQFNHYELISNDSIRFYNSIYKTEMKLKYTLDKELTIYYNCIEGCAEKYKKKVIIG